MQVGVRGVKTPILFIVLFMVFVLCSSATNKTSKHSKETLEPSKKPKEVASAEESVIDEDEEDRLDGQRSGGIWVEGEGELKGRSRTETVSLAAQLIARLVGLSTARRPPAPRPSAKTATHNWPAERWGRGHGRGGWGVGHGRGRGRYSGWRPSNHLQSFQGGSNRGGKMGYGPHGYGHRGHGYYHQGHGIHGGGQTMPRMNHGMPSMNHRMPSMNHRMPSMNHRMPSMNHRMPSMNHQLPRMNQQLPRMNQQLPRLHGGIHPPQGLRPNNLPRVQPPHYNNVKVPQGPQLPNNKALPIMYSPGMPNSKLTLDMLGQMLREGKIPPINFNCNSNNHILHLVKQNSKEDKKKKKRRRKRRAGDSGSYSKEDSGEENEDDDDEDKKKKPIEGKAIIPLLKRVDAKDVHALSHGLNNGRYVHGGYGPHGRPIIHHHGPRVILVCISNTYLQTLIKENSGSGSDSD